MLFKMRFNKQLDRFGVIDRHDPEMKLFLAQRIAEASTVTPFLAAAIASLRFLAEVSVNFPEESKLAVTQGLERVRIIVESEDPDIWPALYDQYRAVREYYLEARAS